MHTTLLEIYTLLLQIDLMSYMTLTEDFVLMVAIASPAANVPNGYKLDPYYITGFSDAESTFSLRIYKDSKYKTGWCVSPAFSIHLHKKDLKLLHSIKSFFGVGNIHEGHTKDLAIYTVPSVKDLVTVIIPHFNKYPLLTKKKADFELFKLALEILVKKEHLCKEGLKNIIKIRASINKGLSEALKKEYPNITPVARPLVNPVTIFNPYWIAGFVEGEGSFMVEVTKSKTIVGQAVNLRFKLSQHSRDTILFRSLMDYLYCGKIRVDEVKNVVYYTVARFSDIFDKIIPLFAKYELHGNKKQDYIDFCHVANLMKEKAHLTKNGLESILNIKSGMNNSRIITKEGTPPSGRS